MSISSIPFLVGIFGFSYLILALQVSSGFPPFYKKANLEEDMKLDLPFMFGVLALLATSTIFPYLFVIFGLLSAFVVIRVRRRVQERTNGPLPWLLSPITIGVFNRWPMFLFDAWTIGLAALMITEMFARWSLIARVARHYPARNRTGHWSNCNGRQLRPRCRPPGLKIAIFPD